LFSFLVDLMEVINSIFYDEILLSYPAENKSSKMNYKS